MTRRPTRAGRPRSHGLDRARGHARRARLVAGMVSSVVATVVAFLFAFLLIMATPGLASAQPTSFDSIREDGLLWAYLGVFAAGFGTSLTPCVYPMITITVGIFGARQATSRWRAFGLATVYVLGMAAMYSALGVAMALSGRASGAGFLLAHPAIVIPIVVLYVVLAASMFGVFELQLPASLQAKLSGVGGRGLVGTFVMGLVGGFTAAPCTGPILAGLLAFVATTGDPWLGLTLMFTYAIGMGVLFWVIATFALSLPKSGPWMELVKVVGGIALLVVGFYFLRPLWPPLGALTHSSSAFFLGAVLATAAGVGLVVLSVRFTARGAEASSRLAKVAGIVLATVGAIALVNHELAPAKALPWRKDRLLAVAEAKASGRPALLDFSADWCEPCKKFEADVLADADVHAEVTGRFVAIKADVTKDTKDDQAFKESWRAPVLPTVILLGSDGAERARFQDVPSAREFLTVLRAVE